MARGDGIVQLAVPYLANEDVLLAVEVAACGDLTVRLVEVCLAVGGLHHVQIVISGHELVEELLERVAGLLPFGAVLGLGEQIRAVGIHYLGIHRIAVVERAGGIEQRLGFVGLAGSAVDTAVIGARVAGGQILGCCIELVDDEFYTLVHGVARAKQRTELGIRVDRILAEDHYGTVATEYIPIVVCAHRAGLSFPHYFLRFGKLGVAVDVLNEDRRLIDALIVVVVPESHVARRRRGLVQIPLVRIMPVPAPVGLDRSRHPDAAVTVRIAGVEALARIVVGSIGIDVVEELLCLLTVRESILQVELHAGHLLEEVAPDQTDGHRESKYAYKYLFHKLS